MTDAHGRASNVSEVLVVAGDRCADGMDDDLDGLLDTDDPGCDAPAEDTARVLLLADQAGYAATGPVDALKVFRDDSGAPALYGGTIPLRHLGTDRPALLQILVGRSGACWVGAVVVTDPALGAPSCGPPVLPGLRPGDPARPPPGHRGQRNARPPPLLLRRRDLTRSVSASNRGAVLGGHRSRVSQRFSTSMGVMASSSGSGKPKTWA